MKQITVAMYGVTGRMGTNQHFIRSILAIIRDGGLKLANGQAISVKPILLGRDESKLRHLAESVAPDHIGSAVDWSTDLDAVLSDSDVDIFFDSGPTALRADVVRHAIDRGKSVYCEKPVAADHNSAIALAEACEAAGIKNGVVHDKLWLPGIQKLRRLIESGFFGRILSVRGEFGYWVFTRDDPMQPAQRPSWNSRRESGGGMIRDMFCHWHYLLTDLFGPIDRVLAHSTTDIPKRVDETGKQFECDADDSAYAIFVLNNGMTCQFNCSWATRVRRDDLLTIQVDGTEGSAVAGLRDCWTQSLAETPRAVWNPDEPQPVDCFSGWTKVEEIECMNAFRHQWELFFKHVAEDEHFPWNFRSGAAGVALAEAGERSVQTYTWVGIN